MLLRCEVLDLDKLAVRGQGSGVRGQGSSMII